MATEVPVKYIKMDRFINVYTTLRDETCIYFWEITNIMWQRDCYILPCSQIKTTPSRSSLIVVLQHRYAGSRDRNHAMYLNLASEQISGFFELRHYLHVEDQSVW